MSSSKRADRKRKAVKLKSDGKATATMFGKNFGKKTARKKAVA